MNIKNIKELKELNQLLKTKYLESNLHDYEVKDLDEVLKKVIEKLLATSFNSDYLSSKYVAIVDYCLETDDISEDEILNLKQVADEKADEEKRQKLYNEAFSLLSINNWTKKARLQKRNSKSLSLEVYATYSHEMYEVICRYLSMFLDNTPNDSVIMDNIRRIEGKSEDYRSFWSGKFQYNDIEIQLFKNKSCVFIFKSSEERDLVFKKVQELANLSGKNEN